MSDRLDEHHDLICEECGDRPTLVRLGTEKPVKHASYGVECGCIQMDGWTPVGAYVDLYRMPESWTTTDD